MVYVQTIITSCKRSGTVIEQREVCSFSMPVNQALSSIVYSIVTWDWEILWWLNQKSTTVCGTSSFCVGDTWWPAIK